MEKARIIKRENVDGRIEFVIQQRHFFFRWWWVDAYINCGVDVIDTFSAFDEAQKSLCYFDGSRPKETICEWTKAPEATPGPDKHEPLD